ncbi:hypothetical protein [Demequina sp. NBRC 110056]|uniref:hypothetical protein n=1 Tax=Demequina sp. NBRC 110056 TaxID=1570345 RepID=UPI000A07AB73|nr:hypothetical protein [Demequina sp. NBRC 110056]
MRIVLRVVVSVVLVIAGAAAALWAASAFPQLSPFAETTETQDSQVVNAVNRTEQIALVSLGIQGITETRESSELFGFAVPGSERVAFIQYSFNAKLGLDGEDVSVTPTGEKSYLVAMPEFIFIGHDDIEFSSAVEDNGVLSWATADIDPLEVVNDVLDNDAQADYLEANEELLQEQAEAFYRSIVMSVDPEIDVAFEFAN